MSNAVALSGWVNTGDVEKGPRIAAGNCLAAGLELRELLQLDEPDRREHVAEVHLEAGLEHVVAVAAAFGVSIPGVVSHAVQGQATQPLGRLRLIQRHHPSLPGGQVLRRVEAEARGVTDAADHPFTEA